MLTCLSEINHYRGAIIKYLAGASGEFLGLALAQTFPDIAKFNNQFSGEQDYYVSNNRVRFHDFFGYSLLTGSACDDNHQLVIDRINWYLDYSNPLGGLHLGVAHPHSEFLRFISRYCSTWKTITITVSQPVSKNFCMLSKQIKLNSGSWDPHHQNLLLDTGLQNLNLEWEDVVLGSSTNTVRRIEDFLKINGSVDTFEAMRLGYIKRNQDIVDQAVKLI